MADFGKSGNHQLKMSMGKNNLEAEVEYEKEAEEDKGERGLQEEEEWGERRKRGKRRKW